METIEIQYRKPVPKISMYEVENMPIILDPNIFTPRKELLTRYGRKLLEEGKQYYGKVTINP